MGHYCFLWHVHFLATSQTIPSSHSNQGTGVTARAFQRHRGRVGANSDNLHSSLHPVTNWKLQFTHSLNIDFLGINALTSARAHSLTISRACCYVSVRTCGTGTTSTTRAHATFPLSANWLVQFFFLIFFLYRLPPTSEEVGEQALAHAQRMASERSASGGIPQLLQPASAGLSVYPHSEVWGLHIRSVKTSGFFFSSAFDFTFSRVMIKPHSFILNNNNNRR